MAEDVVVDNIVESSPEESKARELGWKPLEEYDGPQEKWVDAHEFVSRQPLFEKIDSLKSELWKTKQEHQREFAQIKQHFSSVKEAEYKRALSDLKAQKVEAIDAGDSKVVLEIDDRIDELKDQHAQAQAQQQIKQQQQGPDPAFVDWLENNSWYSQDVELRSDADAFAMQFVTAHPTAPITDVLAHVDKKMKSIRQSSDGSRQAASVESSTSTSAHRGKSKFSERDLSEQERDVMRTLVARKILTKEQYIDQLAEAKGLK